MTQMKMMRKMTMPRPMYETPKDLHREQEILQRVCTAWNCEAQKLPISYKLDYAICKAGDISGFVEIKHRHTNWGSFPDIMLSLSKFTAASLLYEVTRKPCLFVVGTDDGQVHWCHLHHGDPTLELRFGGRTTNTRDQADIEPVYHIPNHLFAKLHD